LHQEVYPFSFYALLILYKNLRANSYRKLTVLLKYSTNLQQGFANKQNVLLTIFILGSAK